LIGIDLEQLQEFFILFGVQLSTVIFLLFLASKIREFVTDFNDKELIASDNRAIVMSSGGYYIAVTLVIASSLYGESFGAIHDFVAVTAISFIGIALLTLNRYVINRVYFREFNAQFEIESENVAFAILQAGGFISVGVVIFYGFHTFEFTVDLLVINLFYIVLTQLLLYFIAKLLFFVTPYDDIKELKRGNVAVALNFFGIMLSLSILFGNSIKEVLLIDLNSIAILLLYYLFGTLFLLYIPKLITALLLSINKGVDEAIEEGNVAVATTEVSVRVIIVITLVSTMPLNIFIPS
jgi:putative membrane protein